MQTPVHPLPWSESRTTTVSATTRSIAGTPSSPNSPQSRSFSTFQRSPSSTIPAAVVARLATHERIVGTRSLSCDLVYFQQVREATDSESFALLTGADALVLASTLRVATVSSAPG